MAFRQSLTGIVIWTILRIWIGWQWLTSGWGKVFGEGRGVWVGGKAGIAITGFLKGALGKTAGEHPDVQAWYGWFINNIALPNAKIFSYMVAFGELLVGIALLLGLLTVPALLGGFFLNLNFLLAGAVSMNPILLTIEAILLLVGPASYSIGLDRWAIPDISKRWRRRRYLRPADT